MQFLYLTLWITFNMKYIKLYICFNKIYDPLSFAVLFIEIKFISLIF